MLHRDGADLLDAPTTSGSAALDAMVSRAHRVDRLVTAIPRRPQRFLDATLAAGHEGVMAKAPDAPYEAGRRGAGWLKVKPVHTLDLVVLAVEWGSGRRTGKLSNIHLGARDPASGGFVMLGKTFKGMTDAMLDWQTARFTRTRRRARPTATSCRCGPSRWSRSRSTACRGRPATRAGWRCGSPGCCATATTRAPPRPTHRHRAGVLRTRLYPSVFSPCARFWQTSCTSRHVGFDREERIAEPPPRHSKRPSGHHLHPHRGGSAAGRGHRPLPDHHPAQGRSSRSSR